MFKSLSLLGLILVLGACAPVAAPMPAATAASQPTAGSLTKVQLALGFVPSVQSAPYYVAQDKGYYAAAGLEVEIKYGAIANLLAQVASGDIAFASVSGDSLIPQKLQGVNITYILSFWSKNPIGALGIAGNNTPSLKTPADLKGKNVGVSAPNGSTHFALKALLQAAKLKDADVNLVAIGTTEVEALTQKRIDAAMTFLPNEAAQMKSLGYNVETIAVSDYLNLVPPGLAAGDKTIQTTPDLVQKFVNATLRGYKDALANPDAAFATSLKRMPELSPDKQPLQKDTLAATFDYYKPPTGRAAGASDPTAWPATQDFLKTIGVIDHTIDPTSYFTNKFAEAAKP